MNRLISKNKSLCIALVLVLLTALSCNNKKVEGIVSNNVPENRPRVIVTTDGEIDDKNSFVRFLLYLNDFDLEGLVYTNSMWHPEGNGISWMHDFVKVYAQVYPNLQVHDNAYPLPSEIESKIFVGQMNLLGTEAVGEGKDTPGSDHIVTVLTDDDLRPVWLQAWGGLNNIAQALWRIRESHPDKLAKAISKARVYAIAEQDDLKSWMQTEFPDVQYILNAYQFWRVIAYSHDRLNPLIDNEIYTSEWLAEQIKSVGSLGALYPQNDMHEGDSPAFFHVINTGLRSTENPLWGGWGGRFVSSGDGNFYTDASDEGDKAKPLWRFIVPICNDWVARMQWTITNEYLQANHHPVVQINTSEDMYAQAGENVVLDAGNSYDPDGDSLVFNWWHYSDISGSNELKIENNNQRVAYFVFPENSNEEHIILEVSDNHSSYPLKRYKRVIIRKH